MNKTAAIVLLALVLLIVLVRDTGEPPAMLDSFVETAPEIKTVYFPFTAASYKTNCLSISSSKAGLAWANRGKGFDASAVCFPNDFHWHAWNWKGTSERRRNVLWGASSFEGWAAGTPTDYDGLVFFANEPDLSGQADMTPTEVAELALAALEHAPNICLVGPMLSAADNGNKSKQFYFEYIRLGGNPDRLCYGSLHMYQRPQGGINDGYGRVTEYYSNYLIPTGQGHKRIFVTEVGYGKWSDNNLLYERVADWLCDFEKDSRVVEYYVFTSFYQERFWGMFYWDEPTKLTPLGEAVRDVAGGWVCEVEK